VPLDWATTSSFKLSVVTKSLSAKGLATFLNAKKLSFCLQQASTPVRRITFFIVS